MRKRRTSTIPPGRRSSPQRSRPAGRTAGSPSTGTARGSRCLGTLGGFDVTGATVVFELVVDDYAEIWVDGQLPLVLGQTGGQLIKGFNAPNRVVLTRDARPGQQIQLAVFGVNGPISRATGELHLGPLGDARLLPPGPGGRAGGHARPRSSGSIPRSTASCPRARKIEKLAGGFQFIEGPVWHPDGYLLFSDPNANTIYRWTPEGAVSVFRTQQRLRRRRHRRVPPARLQRAHPRPERPAHDQRARQPAGDPFGADWSITVLADRYEGKRLNSPNDLVYRSDGTLYFTDPPFGLPKAFDDPRKELPFSGVYMVKDGQVTLLTKELSGPNGIAFSPDERYLYVDNWDLGRKVMMRYEVQRRRDDREREGVPRFHRGSRSRSRSTASRWTSRATSTSRRPAGCGSSRPRGSRSDASFRRSTTPTSPSATRTDSRST